MRGSSSDRREEPRMNETASLHPESSSPSSISPRLPAPVPPREPPPVSPRLPAPVLPHHKLLAYGAARDLVAAVRAARIRGAHLRDQALRAAVSCALNAAEGAARVSPADKARAFTIARGEACEAAAAVEIAALCGEASAASAAEVARLADRAVALLTPLARRGGAAR
jgi:four helix bundle protein